MVGNGMAGMKAIEEILEANPDLFHITVFGAEPYPNYNRILLSTVLAGEAEVEDIIINDRSWYSDRGITLHTGCNVTKIHRGLSKVTAEDGTEADYDNLIIATGSNPFIIPIPGTDKDGVVTFRDIDDCRKMTEASKTMKKAAVIGGGLLGLEAAKGLINLGMEVTVIHDQAYPMNMQLDEVAGGMLRGELEAQGMRFMTSTLTSEILGNGRVEGLRFKDGTEIETDILVMAVGIRPNKELAESALLHCNRGIVVNDYMQTLTDPAVFAVGECAEHRGKTYGLVAPLYEQARILAYHITGNGVKSYQGSDVSTKLKVSGVDVFSAGDFTGDKDSDKIEYLDKKGGVYKKIVLKDDRVTGAVLFGDTADGFRLFQMILDSTDVSGLRTTLLFGDTRLGDTGHGGASSVAKMPPEATVCGCNGITKGAIMDAVKEKGLTTRAEVTGCTKAAGSCGGCGSLVDQIIASVVGGAFTVPTHMAPICPCTDSTHEEVKVAIFSESLKTVGEVMSNLAWKTEGCNICRPALNYYVQMVWPREATDDRYSRLANERIHGNIQKDGTYSVIPRVYGGVTTAEDLIKIGTVAKKHGVPEIKITGGQRIDLLGVKKEDLTGIWEDLGMPSGYAYGKALRTVKTCVGSTWCRFGTQDSMGLGVELEKKLERIWAPAKIKLAVSGCPRNCAEASIKDLGIVGVQGGWEIYCGGNGGVKVRAADILTTATEREEVIELTKAFIQFYREDARHGERTAHWIERVGLDKVKDAVVEDVESRANLAARLDEYLATLTTDPWEEAIADSKKGAAPDYEPIDIGAEVVNR